MKRPAFQFYPADWRNNAKLRRCSDAAQGAWIGVMCLLHDSDEYGVLRWPLVEIARAAGFKLSLLRELAEKDVLKGGDKGATPYIYAPRHAGKVGASVTLVEPGDGPCWYCSRFVRDEWVRNQRGALSRFTADKQPSPKVGIGERQGDGSTSSSTSTGVTSSPRTPAASEPVDNPAGQEPGKAKARTDGRRGDSDAVVLTEGKCRGVEPRVGESMEAYRRRVYSTQSARESVR